MKALEAAANAQNRKNPLEYTATRLMPTGSPKRCISIGSNNVKNTVSAAAPTMNEGHNTQIALRTLVPAQIE